MATKNNENQAISEKSSTANESIEETVAKVESVLDSGVSQEEAFEQLVGQKSAEAPAKIETKTEETPVKEAKSDGAPPAEAEPEEDEDEDFELPSSYKKETRELFKKLPKQFDSLRIAVAKRERDRDKYLANVGAETNRKTAFAQKLAQSINPYLDNWTARGITPEVGVARAAKLDSLMTSDPEAAVKFAMQMAGIKSINLTTEDIERMDSPKGKPLTETPSLSQDDIRRIVREESEGATRFNEARNSNYQQLETLTNEKTSSGKFRYPGLQDPEFVQGLQPLVTGMLQSDPRLSFSNAVVASIHARGGKVEYDVNPQANLTKQNDNRKLERLKLASNIRPASSSSNGMNLDDIEIPDSIEDTIRLAESLVNRAG